MAPSPMEMSMPLRMSHSTERSPMRPQRSMNSERRPDTPIDWSHLSRFTMNDRALEQEVLGLFAMEAPRYLARIQSPASRKDGAEAAHTLKGSARAVGAWAIAECAQAVEALQMSAQHEHSEPWPGARGTGTAGQSVQQALDRLTDAVRRTLAYIELRRTAGSGTNSNA
jgi:HPt (histidine-containing phosphotransfer) domain-containing protein